MHHGVDIKHNNSTAISIPASTSLLVLNCTYSGNVTMNFDQQFQIIVKVVYQFSLLEQVQRIGY